MQIDRGFKKSLYGTLEITKAIIIEKGEIK
jgi:hypothetical protein